MNNKTHPLHGKSALITGASSGIGKHIAETLAGHGVNVILLGRNKQRLSEVSRGITERGGRADVFACDFTSVREISECMKTIGSTYPSLDILVHSAGLIIQGPIEHSAPGEDATVLTVNTLAPMHITGALLPALKKAKGQVIFINSSIVKSPKPNYSAYRASKLALESFADTLREEVRQDGVNVTGIYPASTATPMQQMVKKKERMAYIPEELLRPGDIAQAVAAILLLPDTISVSSMHVTFGRASRSYKK